MIKLASAKDICEALGLNPSVTSSILIDIRPNQPIEVTVRQHTQHGFADALKHYALIETKTSAARDPAVVMSVSVSPGK